MASFQINFRDAVFKWLDENTLKMESTVASGGATDWADYRYQIGVIRGFTEATEAFLKIEDDLHKG